MTALIGRYRRELAPIWAALVVYSLAALFHGAAPQFWPFALPVGAAATAVAARQASRRRERVYALAVGAFATVWSVLAWWAGPDHGPLVLALVVGGIAAELPWAWHHLHPGRDGEPWWHAYRPSRRRQERALRRLVAGWPALAAEAGLEGVQVQSAELADHGWSFHLRVPPRLTLADLNKHVPRLEAALDVASGHHVRPGAVKIDPDQRRASRCHLRVLLTEPVVELSPESPAAAEPTVEPAAEPAGKPAAEQAGDAEPPAATERSG